MCSSTPPLRSSRSSSFDSPAESARGATLTRFIRRRIILTPNGSIAWLLVVPDRHAYERAVVDATIVTLVGLRLLQHALTEDHQATLTDYGIRTCENVADDRCVTFLNADHLMQETFVAQERPIEAKYSYTSKKLSRTILTLNGAALGGRGAVPRIIVAAVIGG